MNQFSNFLSSTILETTPILLAALAALITHKANILNVAVEGMMLTSAFVAIAAGQATDNAGVAVLSAVAAGAAMAIIFGAVTLFSNADHLVAGLGINLLAAGLTVFLLQQVYDQPGGLRPQTFPQLWRLPGGWLHAIPGVGPALTGQSIIVVLAVLLVPACSILLYRTPFGYALRSAGEDEQAARAAGINVLRTRFTAVLISGALAGLAGAQVSMGTLDFFLPNMTNGRGFLGLAAMLFGAATPSGSLAASVLFGGASAAGDQLQGGAIPNQIVLAFPYVAAIVALTLTRIGVLARRRRQRPATTNTATARIPA